MSMVFYYGSGSPYAWRVWLALEHKALAYDFRLVSFSAGDLKTEDFGKLNPRRKVPVLTDGDFTLYESAAIVEYLDERYPTAGLGRLFPEDLRQRALVRRVILEADNYLAPGVRPMQHEVFFKPKSEWNPAVIEQGKEALKSELDRLEAEVQGNYLLGTLTAADYTVYPMMALVARLDERFGLLDLDNTVGPKLRAWMERMRKLPEVERTCPPHWKN
jgi:glutathione S-transferase